MESETTSEKPNELDDWPPRSLDFVLQEFISLRQEIEGAKERAFKLSGIGILAVPALSTLGEKFEVILPVIPFIVLSVLLIFLAENRAICRCGTYIRRQIEPLFYKKIRPHRIVPTKFFGWETWINASHVRAARQVSLLGFYFLFGSYYLYSSIVAIKYLSPSISGQTEAILLLGLWGFYVIPGMLVGIFIAYEHLFDFGERYREQKLSKNEITPR